MDVVLAVIMMDVVVPMIVRVVMDNMLVVLFPEIYDKTSAANSATHDVLAAHSAAVICQR